MFYLKIKNFKAYEQSDWIKIAPLTLVYGMNSAGKSAIIQATRLVSSALNALSPRYGSEMKEFSGLRKSLDKPIRIPLSGIDENKQIFDLGDFRQVVFGQSEKRTITLSIRHVPETDEVSNLSSELYAKVGIGSARFEHKLDLFLSSTQDKPDVAELKQLKFGFKDANVGAHIWRLAFEEFANESIDQIRAEKGRREFEEWVSSQIPKSVNNFMLPKLEASLSLVTNPSFATRQGGMGISNLFEISKDSLVSFANALKPFFEEFFPDELDFIKPGKRFFISIDRTGRRSCFCLDEADRENETISGSELDWLFDELNHEEDLQRSRKTKKMSLRPVRTNSDWTRGFHRDGGSPANIDAGYLLPLIIHALCSAVFRVHRKKFGDVSHIPGFRGQPARYENIMEAGASPLSITLTELSRKTDILNLVLADLEKLGISLSATPKQERISGAQLQSFDIEPKSSQKIILSLADIGFGVSQILPIITSIRSNGGETTHILIEEPEAHLHPSLQGNLMEHFAINSRARNAKYFAQLKEMDPPSELYEKHDFIIETHSENLVTRIQKLISQGKVNNRRVAVIFCSQSEGVAHIKEIEISSTGKLMDPWPNDFIEPIFDESSDL